MTHKKNNQEDDEHNESWLVIMKMIMYRKKCEWTGFETCLSDIVLLRHWTIFYEYMHKNERKFLTYHPGTSSGSSQLPEPSESPILKTVPIGHPYSRATPSKQMKYLRQSSGWACREKEPAWETSPAAGQANPPATSVYF